MHSDTSEGFQWNEHFSFLFLFYYVLLSSYQSSVLNEFDSLS